MIIIIVITIVMYTNVYVMFYCVMPWFYKKFRSENLECFKYWTWH